MGKKQQQKEKRKLKQALLPKADSIKEKVKEVSSDEDIADFTEQNEVPIKLPKKKGAYKGNGIIKEETVSLLEDPESKQFLVDSSPEPSPLTVKLLSEESDVFFSTNDSPLPSTIEKSRSQEYRKDIPDDKDVINGKSDVESEASVKINSISPNETEPQNAEKDSIEPNDSKELEDNSDIVKLPSNPSKNPSLSTSPSINKINVSSQKKTFSPPLHISKSTLAEPKVHNDFAAGSSTSTLTNNRQDNVAGVLPGQAMGLPKEFDITMTQAAQLGNLVALEYLLEKDPKLVNEVDSGNNTPLHWASINSKLEAARYLISNGADPNARGGELQATPLHWACRQGLLDMMVLLIELGADPLQQDSQGFNILHLSVHSTNLMCLLYSIAFLQSSIDVPDGQGHTALMWAAYQGFPIAVDLLLRFGASVNSRDSTQYSPLHWAVVKGDQEIIEKIISFRCDLKAVDCQGQTASDVALNTKTESSLNAALKATGYDPSNLSKPCKIWTKSQVKITALILPVPVLCLVFSTFIYFPWMMALPLVLFQLWLTFHFGIKKLLAKCHPKLCLQESPYHVGIFLTTIVFTFVTYIAGIAKDTFENYFWANVIFSCIFAASLYFYYLATLGDPGYLPRFKTLSGRSDEIRKLAKEGRLSPRHFCTSCLAPRPLRSKHCRFCDRCVARFDHHCPWNYNCVGAQNHRDFMLFVITLTVGICFYLYIGHAYLYSNYISYVPVEMPCIFNDRVCGYFQQSPFTTFNLIWSAIQLSWIGMVLVYQTFLISRATTTNEQVNHEKYSYFIASPLSEDEIPPQQSTSSTVNRLSNLFHSRHDSHQHPHRKFRNPFDQGIWGNCVGFWVHRPGTNYWKNIYDPPSETVDYSNYSSVPLQEITSAGENSRHKTFDLNTISEENEDIKS